MPDGWFSFERESVLRPEGTVVVATVRRIPRGLGRQAVTVGHPLSPSLPARSPSAPQTAQDVGPARLDAVHGSWRRQRLMGQAADRLREKLRRSIGDHRVHGGAGLPCREAERAWAQVGTKIGIPRRTQRWAAEQTASLEDADGVQAVAVDQVEDVRAIGPVSANADQSQPGQRVGAGPPPRGELGRTRERQCTRRGRHTKSRRQVFQDR